MSSTYTTLLGTVSFTTTTDSWAEPSTSSVEVLDFPGGDAIAVSVAGQRETRRTFKALFSSIAVFKNMRAMRAGTLVTSGMLFVENWDTTPVNALLVAIRPDPMQVDGQVLATTEFLLY